MSAHQAILDAVARRESTQLTIAAEYARAILSGGDGVDWPLVNDAILKRYKPSALPRIKRLAWALCQPVQS